MFKSAVLRLTAWYLLIIVVIGIFFSSFIYFSSLREVRYGLNDESSPQVLIGPGGINGQNPFENWREQTAESIRHRMLIDLLEFNLLILMIGGCASYLLAQRTLRPIESAHDAQSRFTADASHELRTPLTAMRSEIEVALRDGKLSKVEAVEQLRSNLEEVEKLERLSAGLLKLAQHDGADSFNDRVALTGVVHEAIQRHAKAAKKHRVEIDSNVEELEVIGDADALTDLLGILIDNAIKYSNPGGKVSITAKRAGDLVKIEVGDHGVGIKALDLPLIFGRFFRADSSRSKAEVNGYGLGLSIAHKIVSNHGGTIEAASTPGKGSTFTVTLKRAKA